MKKIIKVFTLILIIFFICFIAYRVITSKENNDIVIGDEQLPEAVSYKGLEMLTDGSENKELVEEKVYIEDKEVVNSNNDVTNDTYEAMVVKIDSILDENGEREIKVMLVNGNVFTAVFADDKFDINNLSMSDEIKFEGEIRDNKIYINKVLDVVSFMERV